MSNRTLSAVSPTAELELLVIVNIDEATGEVRAEPTVLKVPYGFRGYIRWRIDHPDAKFEETPIVFTDGPRTVPPPATPKTCHVWWENAGAGSYSYETLLQHGLRHVKPDPTVENEPPGF
jgi:hypothetical protein